MTDRLTNPKSESDSPEPEAADQAQQLRAMASNQPSSIQLPALAITGGKGGIGKTCLSVNLSLALLEQGLKPLLIDLDLGLANADVMLGLNPSTTLYDVIVSGRPLTDAIVPAVNNLPFMPAASGREELTQLQPKQIQRLLKELSKLSSDYDLFVFDTAAGIGREVSLFLHASRTILVVVTPEPTSIADAYALIKVIETKSPGKDIRIVVNQSANQDEAVSTFARLRKVALAYLQRDLVFFGAVPRDRAVGDAVRRRRPLVLGDDGPAVQAIRSFAMRLKNEKWQQPSKP
jgi:flagellar biosynthesis protein FlhG